MLTPRSRWRRTTSTSATRRARMSAGRFEAWCAPRSAVARQSSWTATSRHKPAAGSCGLSFCKMDRLMNLPTRSANHHDHRLQTPETFVRAPLPGMPNAPATPHTSPAGRSAFVQYTVEFERGGALAACGDQRFVYVLEGRISVGAKGLEPGGGGCIPAG